MTERIYIYKCAACGHEVKSDHPYREKCPVCGKKHMVVVSAWQAARKGI